MDKHLLYFWKVGKCVSCNGEMMGDFVATMSLMTRFMAVIDKNKLLTDGVYADIITV